MEPSEAAAAATVRRIKRNSIGAYVVFAIFAAFYGGFREFLGLTCTAAVTIISFLWLDEALGALLQPSPQLHSRRLMVRAVARFGLLGVALLVLIFVARQEEARVVGHYGWAREPARPAGRNCWKS